MKWSLAPLGLAVLLGAGCRAKPELSALDIANYAARISFSNFRVGVSENMVGSKVYYVDAVVKNGGDRTIAALEVNAAFRDLDGQVVFQQAATAISERRKALGPGQSRRVRLGFEGIPESWNQAAPQLEIARLVLE